MISRTALLLLISAAPALAEGSNWQYVPDVKLEHILMPVSDAGGWHQLGAIVNSGTLHLQSGEVIYTNARIDRLRGADRTSIHWRCFEAIGADLANNDTRCYLLKPAK